MVQGPGPAPPAVVLLGAGPGSRYAASGGAGHKLTARLGRRTVVEWAVHHAVVADVGPVSVVVGATELPLPADVRVLTNPHWEQGLATSLQVAMAAAREDGCDALVVGLADQPRVRPEAWRLVARSRSPIAVAVYGDHRGHPVRLASSVWPLLPSHGDQGARPVMREHPELVAEIPCPGTDADIDTVDDLSRWRPAEP